MSTTQNTTGTNTSNLQFNPIAESIYNALTSNAGNIFQGYMNNPYGNASYTTGAAQSQMGARQSGSNNIQALLQNMLTSGIGGKAGAGFQNAQMGQTNRANQAMSSQAGVQNVMQALQRQMGAAGTGLSYAPQLTGQNGSFSQSSVQQGLGSWLPQLISSGLGAAGGAMGASAGASAGASSGGSSMFSSAPNPNFMSSMNPQPSFNSGMAGVNGSLLASMGQASGGAQVNPFMSYLPSFGGQAN